MWVFVQVGGLLALFFGGYMLSVGFDRGTDIHIGMGGIIMTLGFVALGIGDIAKRLGDAFEQPFEAKGIDSPFTFRLPVATSGGKKTDNEKSGDDVASDSEVRARVG